MSPPPQGPLGEQPHPHKGRVKDGLAGGELVARVLDDTWEDPKGFFGWFCAINHKTIAKRFIVTTLVFFALGGLLAAGQAVLHRALVRVRPLPQRAARLLVHFKVPR